LADVRNNSAQNFGSQKRGRCRPDTDLFEGILRVTQSGGIVLTEDLRIVQLIPAPGWAAMFSNGEFTDYILTPLIAWAHIKVDDGSDDIVGVCLAESRTGEMLVAELDDYFIGFTAPGETPLKGEELAGELQFTREFIEEKQRDAPPEEEDEDEEES
jgi:hypothetical protein